MPCSSSDGMADAYREDPVARRQIIQLQKSNNELTDMLCTLLRSLEGKIEFDAKTQAWFDNHKKWDQSQGR